MEISSSPAFFNEIANHPGVFPYVSQAGDGPVDFSSVWDDCIGIQFERGGWVFHRRLPDVYEVHTLFFPKGPGERRAVDELAQCALSYMFESMGAEAIITQVAKDLPHVRRLAERAGFVWFAGQKDGWLRESGAVDVDFFELTREAWMEGQGCPQQQSSQPLP